MVGVGAMGSRIARRLIAAGHEVVVWNRSASRVAPLAAGGAEVAESPADATRRAEVVITMVADPAALRAVTEGPDGVASAAGAGTTVIQMSTVGPAAVLRLSSLLPKETSLLDAPVLGSVAEAESGSLVVFAGGDAPLVKRWESLLSEFGRIVRVGPIGAGSAAKLVANSTLFGVIGVLGEALLLGEALGLPRQVVFEVLAVTPLAAQTERRRPAIESGDYPARFSLALARKDADLVHEAAASAGAELRVGEAARAWLAEAQAAGFGDQDYSSVLAFILRSGSAG